MSEPMLEVPMGVSEEAWARLARRSGEQWEIDERNPDGEVIGTAYRRSDGSKSFRTGGKRGLIVAWPLDPYAGSSFADPVFVCEGARFRLTVPRHPIPYTRSGSTRC